MSAEGGLAFQVRAKRKTTTPRQAEGGATGRGIGRGGATGRWARLAPIPSCRHTQKPRNGLLMNQGLSEPLEPKGEKA